MSVALEIALILALLVANGMFAMSEIAVVTSREGRLRARADQGDPKAAAVLDLKDEPTDFLSTVQIGITLIGVLAGAFGGARLSGYLAEPLARIGWLAPYAGTTAFILVVGSITYLSLVIGELVPKRIALGNPETIASRLAGPMKRLSRLTHPLVQLLSASTSAVTRLLGIEASDEADVTEEDIRALIAQGAKSGVVHELEEDILERVFLIGDRQVRSVMTPRHELVWVPPDASVTDIQAALETSTRTGLIVCEGSIDDVLGIVNHGDLLAKCLAGEPLNLTDLLVQPHFVPESLPLLRLLRMFRQSNLQVAMALGELGSVVGVVTLSDIMDDLVADIPGAIAQDSDIVQRADGSWLVDGTVPLEDVERELGESLFPTDDVRRSRTLGGLLLNDLGRVPREGDAVSHGDFILEVVDMDGRRVDRVLIQRASVR
ncbi:MAG TPA: hemolysin family protein [Gemmatimonadales bacterium]|nr:hemolysin family protein [Gemmatimonadales bacterium]